VDNTESAPHVRLHLVHVRAATRRCALQKVRAKQRGGAGPRIGRIPVRWVRRTASVRLRLGAASGAAAGDACLPMLEEVARAMRKGSSRSRRRTHSRDTIGARTWP
jgi:hypothetical protein